MAEDSATDPRLWQDAIIAIVHILDGRIGQSSEATDRERFRTASALAQLENLQTPLGHLIYYDTFCQGNWQVITNATRLALGRVGSEVTEAAWLQRFLEERETLIQAEVESAESGDGHGINETEDDMARVSELAMLLASANYALSGTLTIAGSQVHGLDVEEDSEPGDLARVRAAGLASGFSSDVDLQDPLPPGSSFRAIWRYKNSGQVAWDLGFKFVYSQSFVPSTTGFRNSTMGAAADSLELSQLGVDAPVLPGQSVELVLRLIAPDEPGLHASHWQLFDSHGNPVGPVRWTAIQVSDLDAPEMDAGTLAYTGPPWPYGRCLVGIHDRADRHPQPADHAIAGGRFETVKVQTGVTVAEMRAYQPTEDFFLCRLFHSWGARELTVDDFLQSVVPDMERLVADGVRYFEFHNEPNLTSEGLRTAMIPGSWSNGYEFAAFFLEGRKRLRAHFPGIQVGFPGLSPGGSTAYQFGHDSGFRMDSYEFLRQAKQAVSAADFLCVHAYYSNISELSSDTMAWVAHHRRTFADHLLFISEFSNPRSDVGGAEKGMQAKAFFGQLEMIPGIAAAYYFIVSGSGWDTQSLRDSRGKSTGFVESFFA